MACFRSLYEVFAKNVKVSCRMAIYDSLGQILNNGPDPPC